MAEDTAEAVGITAEGVGITAAVAGIVVGEGGMPQPHIEQRPPGTPRRPPGRSPRARSRDESWRFHSAWRRECQRLTEYDRCAGESRSSRQQSRFDRITGSRESRPGRYHDQRQPCSQHERANLANRAGATNPINGNFSLNTSPFGNGSALGSGYGTQAIRPLGSNFFGSGVGNSRYGYGNSGYGFGNSGYGYGGNGYGYGGGGYGGSGYGNGNSVYVSVYLPGVGWVLVPIWAIRGF